MSGSDFAFGIFATVVIVHIAICALVANAAQKKGRSWAAFYFLSFIGLWPFMAIAVAVMAPINNSTTAGIGDGDDMKCPFCAEWVKIEAIVCKHCGRDIPESYLPPVG